jgi:hypothetical protein
MGASLLEGCLHRAPVVDCLFEVLGRVGVLAGVGCQ